MRSLRRTARPFGRWPSGSARRSHTCATRRSRDTGPTATAAPAWSKSRASACWRPRACARPPRAWSSTPRRSAPRRRANWSSKCWSPISRHGRPRMTRSRSSGIGRTGSTSREPLPGPRNTGGGPEPSRHGGQSGCLHPMQPLRPRVPRGPGQRRHRHGLPRPRVEDRLRLRRSDGRQHLRGLRRMRAGLPDRCAHAGHDARRAWRPRALPGPDGRQRLSLLRRRLPDHLQHCERQTAVRRRPQRPRQRDSASASRAASASTTCTIRID